MKNDLANILLNFPSPNVLEEVLSTIPNTSENQMILALGTVELKNLRKARAKIMKLILNEADDER